MAVLTEERKERALINRRRFAFLMRDWFDEFPDPAGAPDPDKEDLRAYQAGYHYWQRVLDGRDPLDELQGKLEAFPVEGEEEWREQRCSR